MGHASKFFRADLRDFIPFPDPLPLRERFENARDALLVYYEENKVRDEYRRTLFYAKRGEGLRGVAGAYFTEVDERLAAILFGAGFAPTPTAVRPPDVSARTGEILGSMRRRVGQRDFASNVLENYGGACCFPGCDVRDWALLVGSHIVRWADAPSCAARPRTDSVCASCTTGSSRSGGS